MRCSNCGSAFSPTDSYCGKCGKPITSGRPLPGSEGNSWSAAERRRLTVMFCDLVGSTELSGQLDPEDLHYLITQYQQTCAEVIEHYGGHIAQYLGDGLLVYFGYPLAHEDDARRAVSAGLDIVAAVAQLRERLAKSLQVRVAVHTGLAIVGRLGEGNNPDALAIAGETPNIAGRLQSIADPGTVIISAPTYQLVQGFFLCRGVGAPPLKGVAVPMELYSVLEESGIQSRFEQAVTLGLTPFVSRENEVRLLLQRWNQARDGSGQVVLLSGEPGIGKSRLMRVLKERTAGEAVIDLAARCSPYYQDSALYPVIGFFEYFLQFQRENSAEAKLTALERALENFGFPLAETVPLFAALLSLPFSHRYSPLSMTPQRQKQLTFEAMVAWLLKAAARHPTRVVFEDVHWADPSTLELLGLLMRQVSQARLLLTLVFRSDFSSPWPSQLNVTSITIGRLSRPATESMIESVANGERLPTRIVREIAEKTDGVPLFIEELTRMVLELGILREQDGRHESTSSLPSFSIPSTLYESLMARLDRLDTAKEVAQLAATIGKEFSYELLRAISPLDEITLAAALTRLIDAELLDQHLTSTQTNYTFRHALIRDAAYESLLRSKRRQYHRKVAEVLQQHFHETAEAQPELLASHFTEANLIEAAVPYWMKAGQRAIERSANQEAIRHLTRGLELLKFLPESPERFHQEILLQISLGTALVATEGFSSPEVERTYDRARQLCQDAGEMPQLFPALLGLWTVYTSRGEHLTARDLAEHCLRIAQNVGNTGLLLYAHHILGVGFIATGDFFEAKENLERAVEKYDPQEHRSLVFTYGQDPAAFGLALLSWPLWFLGYPDQALRRCREAEALAQKLNHPYTSLTVAAFGAWFYQFTRNPQAVEALASRAISISTDHGFVFYRAYGLIMRGWVLVERGQVLAGIAQMRAGLDEYRATGGGSIKPSFLSLLADAYGKLGQFELALNVLAEAQDLADENEERWWQAELHRIKGELILRHHNGHSVFRNGEIEAEECFGRAVDVATAQKARSLELRAAMSLCRLWMPQSRHSEAQQLLQKTLDTFQEGSATPDLVDARLLMEEIIKS